MAARKNYDDETEHTPLICFYASSLPTFRYISKHRVLFAFHVRDAFRRDATPTPPEPQSGVAFTGLIPTREILRKPVRPAGKPFLESVAALEPRPHLAASYPVGEDALPEFRRLDIRRSRSRALLLKLLAFDFFTRNQRIGRLRKIVVVRHAMPCSPARSAPRAASLPPDGYRDGVPAAASAE